MLVDESSEPLAQGTRLIGNLVHLTGHCARPQGIQCVGRHKFGLSEPPQESITAVEPVDRSIDRRRDGVQEIKTERVGDKNCRRSVFHDWPTGCESSKRITGQAVLDKLRTAITCQVPSRWLAARPRHGSNRMAMEDVSVVLAHGAWAEGPIVLAGHAYAGAVIALASSERVRALVYVTALAPDEGEKVADVFYRLEPHPQAPKLAPDGNGLIWLPEGAFATAFAQNASADDLAVLAAVQRPISVNCITVPVGRPLWQDVPSWFLIAEQDRMIVPQTQRYMAERMKAKTTAQAVDHTPSVTAPRIVVDIIRDAIRSLTGN